MKLGIVGYGNIGRGVECAVEQNSDIELVAVFTRRNPLDLEVRSKTAKVLHISRRHRSQTP